MYMEKIVMLKLKLMSTLLALCGGLSILGAIEVDNLLVAIVTALCGILTVVMSIFLTSHIKHITNSDAHTTSSAGLVTEVTCAARVKGMSDRLDDIHSMLQESLNEKSNKKQ